MPDRQTLKQISPNNSHSDLITNTKETVDSLRCSSSSVAVSMDLADAMEGNKKTNWFKTRFDTIEVHGSIDKALFKTAAREINGFGENLFNIFDTNEQDVISVQELVGGFGMLIGDQKKKENRKLFQWFNEHFKQLCGNETGISRDQFVQDLKNDTVVNNLFTVFDLDGNGEIQMKEFISSLDRLECASVDSKWYRWIEDHFHIDASDNRKITYEQFKKALHLRQSFFSERFFRMFDTDGDGSIDMKELVTGLQILTKGSEKEKLKFLFEVYDIDGNGTLNREEMKVVLQSCVKESNINFSDEQMAELVEVLFKETDADLSGTITFEEFTSCLSRFPEITENLTIT